MRAVPINELFSLLTSSNVPDSDLQDEMPHQQLDPNFVHALGGAHMADQILRLVPNIKSFKLAYKAVVVWAILNGIYSKSAGFLNGVKWGLLVARICQMYPDTPPAVLVHKFFFVFSNGKWPQSDFIKSEITAWEAIVTGRGEYNLLPINISVPRQPHFSFHVTVSAKKIILEKLRQALSITYNILIGNYGWQRLFVETDFFSRYRHYLVLIATSKSKKGHRTWCKIIESKLKHLIIMLESHSLINIALVNTERYSSIPLFYNNGDQLVVQKGPPAPDCNEKDAIYGKVYTLWFIGLAFESYDGDVDLTPAVAAYVTAVHNIAHDKNVLREGMTVKAQHIRHNELTQFLHPALNRATLYTKRRQQEPAPEPPRKKTKLSRRSKSPMNEVTTRARVPGFVKLARRLKTI